MTTKTLQERASELVGYTISEGDVVVMLCPTCGEDHKGEEHDLPIGAIARVADIELLAHPQDIAITLVIPVDPGSDFEDDDAVHIVGVWDENDTTNRFAFRLATPEEQAKLHPSWGGNRDLDDADLEGDDEEFDTSGEPHRPQINDASERIY